MLNGHFIRYISSTTQLSTQLITNDCSMVVGARPAKHAWFSHISKVYRETSEKDIQWAALLWQKMLCWCQKSEENSVDRLLRADKSSNSYTHSLQMGNSSRRPHWLLTCDLKTGNRGYNQHRLTKIGQRDVKIFANLMSFCFCCNIKRKEQILV